MDLGILTVGSELLDGRVTDTNSVYIGSQLADLGVKVRMRLSCDDKMTDIKESLRFLQEHVSIVIVTGGLGPTEDDLTASAVASFVGQTIFRFPDSKATITQKYASRGREVTEGALKQADAPIDAKIISNEKGTAPGFLVHSQQCDIVCLPGVPSEFKHMFQKFVIPWLTRTFRLSPIKRFTFIRTIGIGESDISNSIKAGCLDSKYDIAYQIAFPEVRLKISSRSDDDLVERDRIESLFDSRHILSLADEVPLDIAVREKLERSGLRIHVIQTVGNVDLLSHLLSGNTYTQVSGHLVFEGGGLEKKQSQQEIISEHERRLVAAQFNSESDISILLTGAIIESSGAEEEPTGTFVVSMADSSRTDLRELTLFNPYDRMTGKRVVWMVLALLLDFLDRNVRGVD